MNVDSLDRGLVIDHIQSGKSMEIYRFLELDKLDCSVAIIKNARSKKSGKKDIIKIENQTDIDLDVLGFIDPDITVNIIENGRIIEKKHLNLPEEIVNVAYCKNPRCITSSERSLPHVFRLSASGDGKQVYHCVYCEQEYTTEKP